MLRYHQFPTFATIYRFTATFAMNYLQTGDRHTIGVMWGDIPWPPRMGSVFLTTLLPDHAARYSSMDTEIILNLKHLLPKRFAGQKNYNRWAHLTSGCHAAVRCLVRLSGGVTVLPRRWPWPVSPPMIMCHFETCSCLIGSIILRKRR